MEDDFFSDKNALGLRNVRILRCKNGFGFTLRHFIVYPPDLYSNDGTYADPRNRLGTITEPVDTIFVKVVHENGPADQAGLCIGDRIVSVNGERVVGKSYEQVVQLIQKSKLRVNLEVSPRQFDTLQLFYEDKAHRPETNPRPNTNNANVAPRHHHRGLTHHQPHQSYPRDYLRISGSESEGYLHPYSYESVYSDYQNHNHLPPSHYNTNQNSRSYSDMSTAYPNQQQQQQHQQQQNPQLFSHLPRPTPYKSPSAQTWSHLTQQPPVQQQQQQRQRQIPISQQQQQQQQRTQPQTYYPFQTPAFNSGGGGKNGAPWGILEDPGGTKSAESVVAHSSSSSLSAGNNNRYGSMECLPSVSPQTVVTWKNSPGYRFSISTGPEEVALGGGSAVAPSTGSGSMYVTMMGSHEVGVGSSPTPPEGYELKMADRIRRSTEQKEEFLRRPVSQPQPPPPPPSWTAPLAQPLPPVGVVVQPQSTTMVGFPKEFYAQAQKFQTVPWPPQSRATPMPIVTVSSSVSDSNMTVTVSSSSRAPLIQQHSAKTPSVVVNKEHLRGIGGGSLDETSSRRREAAAANSQHHLYPSVSVSAAGPQDSYKNSSAAAAAYNSTTVAKNRLTVVGSGKLHCDPPPDWKPPSIIETEANGSNGLVQMRPPRPNHLTLSAGPGQTFIPVQPSNGTTKRQFMSTSLDSNVNVIMRKRETDPDYDNDRVVRRESYLKATSSPIDMGSRKGSSPTTPVKSVEVTLRKTGGPGSGRRRSMAKLSAEFLPKGRIIRLKQFFEDRTQPSSLFKFYSDSPSSEFRHFGSLSAEKSPDGSEVIRQSQVHFKVRAGDSKKGGYYRSWRQGWAQIRQSGCLYLSKEKISKDTISGSESDIIVSIGLKEGISIEQAEDYTKRKYVLRIKTTGAAVTAAANPEPQIPVEILIQTEDANEMAKWLLTLQQQQDNNNYYSKGSGVVINPNEMSSPKSSLLRSLLTAPSITTHQPSSSATPLPSTTTGISTPVSASNYLSVAHQNLMTSAAATAAGATSPKSKTWKGKVARQLRKIHLSSSNSSTGSGYGSFNAQTCIPESGGTIGVNLEDCPQSDNSLVPKLMEFCVDTVETRGLGIVGIYRIPGNNAAVGALTESLNRGNEPNPEQDPRWNDVHVISSLLKSFLRKLPDPLLTSERYPDFIKAASDPDAAKALEKLQVLIHDLPDINYETLRHLITHLRKVADHSEKNRMEPRNLAIVFGPTVVRTASENVESLVNDMQQQCRIVELLINNAEEIFKEKEGEESPSPEEQPTVFSLPHNLPTTPPPEIEKNIRAALIQAAQRKVLTQAVQPMTVTTTTPHNTYGLPPNPPERDRPVDESGLIRSYAGLGEDTEQRVRQFEMETRAILHREGRSPSLLPTVLQDYSTTGTIGNTFLNSSTAVVTPRRLENGKHSIEKMRLEAEWRKAKADLENEDFYDQLADNPSRIVQHRELPTYPIVGSHNVSSSSISSTNSGPASNPLISPYGTSTWPIRLGPAPFKSQFATPALPPKPPTGAGQSRTRVTSTSSPSPGVTSPLRKVNSVERLDGTGAESYESTRRGTLKRLKNFDTPTSSMNYDSKGFGSLDSLRDIVNGSREDLSPRSSDGSDLVTSLSKTLDQKLLTLRPGKVKTEEKQEIEEEDGKAEEEAQKTEGENVEKKAPEPQQQQPTPPSSEEIHAQKGNCNGNVLQRKNRIQRRRNSMIDRTKRETIALYGESEEDDAIKISYRDPSLHRSHISGSSWSGPLPKANGHESLTNLTKEAKTVTNKLKREIRRRHSLSGTAEILRFMFEDRNKTKRNLDSTTSTPNTNLSSDAIAAALTANNILESHV